MKFLDQGQDASQEEILARRCAQKTLTKFQITQNVTNPFQGTVMVYSRPSVKPPEGTSVAMAHVAPAVAPMFAMPMRPNLAPPTPPQKNWIC